jgi:hypothetical protein
LFFVNFDASLDVFRRLSWEWLMIYDFAMTLQNEQSNLAHPKSGLGESGLNSGGILQW